MAVGALASICAAGASAGVYKWVDKDGRVIYGDQPPPQNTGQSREINTSGVPLALQERLRQLDRTFTIRRITGNLDNAYVCLQIAAAEAYQPAFVAELDSSNLGTIAPAAAEQDTVDYDSAGRPLYRRGGVRCPEHDNSSADTQWVVYQIHFDPKAVAAYRGAP